jgi:glycerol-3-phosphate dehydrogenase (NAD(P)+)
MNISVLGAGAWGTALAKLLIEGGHTVTLWGHNPANLDEIKARHENTRLLPGIPLPGSLLFEPDLERAAGAELLVASLPSKALDEVAARLVDFNGVIVSTTKGIEFESGHTMSAVIAHRMPHARIAALSGPTIALEVARGIPAAIVAASEHEPTARRVQEVFNSSAFRVYSSTDLLGVELGGALKNVFAIAAGVCDGLGFGDNTKAALITRAIAEMRRLGVKAGAHPETFAGLSGLGDLTVTCFSRHSRNRTFGEKLGRDGRPEEILTAMVSVVEGFPTTRAARQLAHKLGVITPIIDEVHAMLYEGKNPQEAVRDLMTRELKAED